MSQSAIFWPVIAQAALTFVAYMVMSIRRVAAVKAGEARARDFKVPRDPEISATAARNVSNQFELPVLFYVVCLAMHQTDGVGHVALTLAWLFVLSRIVHAWVHLTSNDLRLRRPVFIAGYLTIMAMWAWFAFRLATTGGAG